eukprot:2881491-Rhodomonas_salina.1
MYPSKPELRYAVRDTETATVGRGPAQGRRGHGATEGHLQRARALIGGDGDVGWGGGCSADRRVVDPVAVL